MMADDHAVCTDSRHLRNEPAMTLCYLPRSQGCRGSGRPCPPSWIALIVDLTMKHTISITLFLAALWWLLSGYAQPILLGLGAFSVAFTVWLSRRMDVIDHESHPIHLSLGLIGFWMRLIVEIVVSNLQVIGAILSPRADSIQPHFLRVRMRQSSPLGKVILANAITLTPGTVTVAMEGDELLVHALTRASGDGVREGQLDRLVPGNVEEPAA